MDSSSLGSVDIAGESESAQFEGFKRAIDELCADPDGAVRAKRLLFAELLLRGHSRVEIANAFLMPLSDIPTLLAAPTRLQ